jgi:hypothetical protein
MSPPCRVWRPQGPVESAAEAPIDGENRPRHSPQANALALLLPHDHTSKVWCPCGHVVAHSPREDITRIAYGAYGKAAQRGRLGSNRPYVKYGFSGTPWRWLYWLHRVPVTPLGNYLT